MAAVVAVAEFHCATSFLAKWGHPQPRALLMLLVVDVVEFLYLLSCTLSSFLIFIFFLVSSFFVFFVAHSLQSFGVPLRKEGVLMFSVVKERPYSASSAFSASSSAASFTGVEVHVLALELGVSDHAAGEEACRQHRTCDRRNDFMLFHELCLSWLMMRVFSMMPTVVCKTLFSRYAFHP